MKTTSGFADKILLACLAALPYAGLASCDNGLLWSFEAADGVENGSFDSSKFRDALKVSSAAGPKTLAYKSDCDATPYFTNLTVASGIQATTFENEPCLYLPQPTNWVESASGGYDFVAMMHNAELSHDMLATGDATFYMRLKWDGRTGPQIGADYPHNYSVTLFSNGRDWATATGWEVTLDAYGGLADNGYLGVSVGQKSISASQTSMNNGKIEGKFCDIYANGGWVDIAVTLSSRPDEGANGRTYVSFYRSSSTANTMAAGKGFVEQAISLNRNAIGMLFGNYAKTVTNHNNIRNFRGAVRSVKLWNRALSDDEIKELFAGMRQTWKIGVSNSSSDEFSDETRTAQYDPVKARYHTFPKTLTAQNPSAVISTKLPAHRVNLPRVLFIKPLFEEGDDATGKNLDIALNGTHLGSVALKTHSGNVWFFIPGERIAQCVPESGDFSLSLTRSGNMSGTVSFDSLELGGSFQLGFEDKDHQEFNFNNGVRTIYATVASESHLSSQLFPNQNIEVVFPVSREIAQRYKFRFVTRFFWSNPTALPIDCTLNGETLVPSEIGEPNYTYTYTFEPGELSELNKMNFVTGSRSDGVSTGWGVDYWRLEIVDTQYYGLTLIVK
jgi:hypothetical protein